jgi:hypothetical protein
MIKIKPFALTPLEYFLLHVKLMRVKILLYSAVVAFIFYIKWKSGNAFNTVDVVCVTFLLTAGFLPLLNSISMALNSKNSAFFHSREIEITDQFLIETKEDGSTCTENLAQFKFLKESRNFYYLLNSSVTFYPIKKDSFLTAEDAERFKVQVVDKMKKNGFIEL